MLPLFRPTSSLFPPLPSSSLSVIFILFVTFTSLHPLRKCCLFFFFQVPVKEALGETTGQPPIFVMPLLAAGINSVRRCPASCSSAALLSWSALGTKPMMLPLSIWFLFLFSFPASLFENHFSTCLSPSPLYTVLFDLFFPNFQVLKKPFGVTP